MIAVLEPAPGEVRLWPATRPAGTVRRWHRCRQCRGLIGATAGAWIRSASSHVRSQIGSGKREWHKDFHAMRFGKRLWVCPRHEVVTDPGCHRGVARSRTGLRHRHPCDHRDVPDLARRPRTGRSQGHRFRLWLGDSRHRSFEARRRTGVVHDIDPQALIASAENAQSNDVATATVICAASDHLPRRSGCAPREHSFRSAVRPCRTLRDAGPARRPGNSFRPDGTPGGGGDSSL